MKNRFKIILDNKYEGEIIVENKETIINNPDKYSKVLIWNINKEILNNLDCYLINTSLIESGYVLIKNRYISTIEDFDPLIYRWVIDDIMIYGKLTPKEKGTDNTIFQIINYNDELKKVIKLFTGNEYNQIVVDSNGMKLVDLDTMPFGMYSKEDKKTTPNEYII